MVTLACEFSLRQAAQRPFEAASETAAADVMLAPTCDRFPPDVGMRQSFRGDVHARPALQFDDSIEAVRDRPSASCPHRLPLLLHAMVFRPSRICGSACGFITG
jgi:hypothetical protein